MRLRALSTAARVAAILEDDPDITVAAEAAHPASEGGEETELEPSKLEQKVPKASLSRRWALTHEGSSP